MLWEEEDSAEALASRFGFAKSRSVVEWMRNVMWQAWEIAIDDCDRLIISDGNLLAWISSNNTRLIMKWSVVSKRFQRLADTTSLIMWLHDHSIPVAAPIPARDGQLRVQRDDVSIGVFPVVEGDLLDIDDPIQVAAAGKMLAILHETMAAYPFDIDGDHPSDDKQLIHNDFRSANILQSGSRITAILDFEDAAYKTRISDLARATVMLGTRYRNWQPTDQGVRETFISAYHDQSPLTRGETNNLRQLIANVAKTFGWE